MTPPAILSVSRTRRLRALFAALVSVLSLGVPLLAVALTITACPAVIREPARTPPPTRCTQGATACHDGAPWVCGPDGWSQADRRCDPRGAACCLAVAPYDAGLRHACVPAEVCVEPDVDGGVLSVIEGAP